MPDDLDELEAELARYVHAHSHTAETAEGAHHHWLGTQPHWTVGQVRKVLRRMSRTGLLEAHVLPGGATLYRKKSAGSGE